MTKTNMMKVLTAAALMSGLTGCAMFNKGTMAYSRTTTIGQELIDLQEAKTKGAVTEEEYVKTKKEILKGGPMQMDAKQCKGMK